MEYVIFTMLYLLLAIKSFQLHMKGDERVVPPSIRSSWYGYILCGIAWPIFIWFWLFFDANDV